MSLVNFLRFNDDSGAIISDEEYWNVFFRKRMHGDNLHVLLTAVQAQKTGIQVVYGGSGYPSIHREVVEKTRNAIETFIEEKGASGICRVKDIARIAFDCMQDAIRKRIDQKLLFYYGFTTNDLNAGQFVSQGEKWPIDSITVKENARKLASRETQDTLLKAVMDTRAAVFGYDADGITGYYLSGENSILGYVHEGFEAIGAGKYASGLVFGQDFKAKTIKMRQEGYEPAEGLFELIDSAFLAGEHFKEVGGNYNLIVLNRKETKPQKKVQQVFDDDARMATEIIRAVRAGYLTRNQGIELTEDLILKKIGFSDVEKKLFQMASNSDGLNLILRGYKIKEVSQLLACKSQSDEKGERQ